MQESDLTELKLMITELTASLKERCPRNSEQISKNKEDINGVFKHIRSVEANMAATNQIITKHVGEMKIFITLMTAVLTAGAVKFIMG